MIKWFVDPNKDPKLKIVAKALEKAGNSNRLHKKLNIQLGTILAWRRGAVPNLLNMKKITDFLESDEAEEYYETDEMEISS